ncbi:MAG: YbjQ family protein [Pirellulaceae bacterium]
MTAKKPAANSPLHPKHLPDAPGWPIHPAMVTSTLDLPGFRIAKTFGVVQGLIVRAPGFSGGISAALQSFSGGNVQVFQDLCEKARRDAFVMMMENAIRYGANGIIGFRYDTTEIGQGLSEVLAYGTAIWAETVSTS